MPLLTLPFQSASGEKRTSVSASSASSLAEAADTAPKGVQLLPPSIVNSQVPLVSSTAVTAIPPDAPASGSVMSPEISVETRVPVLLTISSSIVVSANVPLLSSTGASLTAMTVIDTLPVTLVLSAAIDAISSALSARVKMRASSIRPLNS